MLHIDGIWWKLSHLRDVIIPFDIMNRQPTVLLFAFSFQFIGTSLLIYFHSLLICLNAEVAKHVQAFKETEFKLGERTRVE